MMEGGTEPKIGIGDRATGKVEAAICESAVTDIRTDCEGPVEAWRGWSRPISRLPKVID